MRRPSGAELSGAAWAAFAVMRCRRQLSESGLAGVVLPSARRLPAGGLPGVHAVLKRCRATCLTQACILQEWYADHGQERELVIGVRNSEGAFSAHAWLEGPSEGGGTGFIPIHRRLPTKEAGKSAL